MRPPITCACVGLRYFMSQLAVANHNNSCEKSNTSTEPSRNMSSNLPVDALPMILKNLDNADLATMCRVNKVCCSFSQDILYRNLFFFQHDNPHLIWRTLAHSTHLARRVHSFFVSPLDSTMESNQVDNLATALRNMSSLRKLDIIIDRKYSYILEGCTFKLDSFSFNLRCDEYLLNFLNNQPSLTHVQMGSPDRIIVFDSTCLPNLTRVSAQVPWLRRLIPGRPVSELDVFGFPAIDRHLIDWNFFTLSTAPIQKLTTTQEFLMYKPAEFLASIFPSLVHLSIYMIQDLHVEDVVRGPFF
jgi:hypothetical protein